MSLVPMRRGGGMGAMSPWLYESPPGLVTYTKTPYVSGVDSSGNAYTTGGAVIYPSSAPSSPSGYVAPVYAPTPACTQANAGAFVSGECVDLALKAEAQRMQQDNDANRAVFVRNCLAAGNSAAECAGRTYGQTPAGGYTSDAYVQGKQYVQDAAGNFVGPTPPVQQITSIDCPRGQHVRVDRTGCDPNLVASANPPKTTATSTPSGSSGATKNYVDQATAFLGESVPVAGYNFPIWGLAAAGLAALFFLKGGR